MALNAVYLLSPLLLVLLLVSRNTDYKVGVWINKPALSAAFVICAILTAQAWGVFESLMLGGFLFCFLGDVFLIPNSKKLFIVGLVSFLVGHLFFIVAFFGLAAFDFSLIIVACVLLAVYLFVLRWLRPYSQAMLIPVLGYMLVISCMVFAACALALNELVSVNARVLIAGGAMAFFASDLFVVRQRFVSKTFLNPLIGLPLYYGAQFSLATSLAFIE